MTEKGEIYPPPPDTVPDYFCGRLIYEDNRHKDHPQTVVYDGRRYIRFMSRKAAERYCIEQSTGITDEDSGELMRQYYILNKAQQNLDRVALNLLPSHRLTLEQIAVNLRKVSDQLDTFIAQTIHDKR